MKTTAVVCTVLLLAAVPALGFRIFGGQFAEERQFPYQIALFVDGEFHCGGSIIDNRWILTAAHCVLEDDGSQSPNVTILVGTQHLTQGGRHYDPEAIYPHEAFANFQNDIALVKLQEAIEYDQDSQPIVLYDGGDLPKGSEVTISGHGRTETEQFSEMLKFNTMQVDDQDACAKNKQGLICFNEEVGNGACNGDSGGPAVFEGRQVGVANFVQGGCGTDNADGYAKVSHFLQWIEQTKQN